MGEIELDAVAYDDVVMQEFESMRDEFVLEPSEKILAISEGHYKQTSWSWDTLLIFTNKRIIIRPRRNYDTLRGEIRFSEINQMNLNWMLDNVGLSVKFGLINGKEINFLDIWSRQSVYHVIELSLKELRNLVLVVYGSV